MNDQNNSSAPRETCEDCAGSGVIATWTSSDYLEDICVRCEGIGFIATQPPVDRVQGGLTDAENGTLLVAAAHLDGQFPETAVKLRAILSRQSMMGGEVRQDEWREVLGELADLVDSAYAGEYKIDSFTTQPARVLLNKAPQEQSERAAVPDVQDRARLLCPRCHADRLNEPCGNPSDCGMIGMAQQATPANAAAANGDGLADHVIRETVNQVRDIAIKYHDAQQLRSRIADVLVPLLRNASAVGADGQKGGQHG